MARTGYASVGVDKDILSIEEAFFKVHNDLPNKTQMHGITKILFMLNYDKDLFFKLYEQYFFEESENKNATHRAALKILDVMRFYDSKVDKFICKETNTSATAEELIENGYKIDGKQLYVNKDF